VTTSFLRRTLLHEISRYFFARWLSISLHDCTTYAKESMVFLTEEAILFIHYILYENLFYFQMEVFWVVTGCSTAVRWLSYCNTTQCHNPKDLPPLKPSLL
jgi:hypothetical protein